MELRWYKQVHCRWLWDSRNDCWYKSCTDCKYTLQVKINDSWVNVPYVTEEFGETEPPK